MMEKRCVLCKKLMMEELQFKSNSPLKVCMNCGQVEDMEGNVLVPGYYKETTKMVAKDEYIKWEQWLDENVKDLNNRWPDCNEGWDFCEENNCHVCIWNLVGLEGELVEEFLDKVVNFVENGVEELYVHPDWNDDERAKYGPEVGYLVDIYCKLKEEVK